VVNNRKFNSVTTTPPSSDEVCDKLYDVQKNHFKESEKMKAFLRVFRIGLENRRIRDTSQELDLHFLDNSFIENRLLDNIVIVVETTKKRKNKIKEILHKLYSLVLFSVRLNLVLLFYCVVCFIYLSFMLHRFAK